MTTAVRPTSAGMSASDRQIVGPERVEICTRGSLTTRQPASAPGRVVPPERLGALLAVVDDGFGVAVVVTVVGLPRLVGLLPRDMGELWHPAAHVGAVGVELLPLGDRVE